MKKLKVLVCVSLIINLIFMPIMQVSAISYTPDEETLCESALLINLDTDTIVYSKNSDERLQPASLTKIMTAIIAMETYSDLDNTVITKSMAVNEEIAGLGASSTGIMVGEEVTLRNLLYALLLASDCEAASMIAEYYGNGDTAPFIEKMNEKAKEIGCKNTHFVNAHGLDAEGQYSTVYDMYLITKYALNMEIYDTVEDDGADTNQLFEKISCTTDWYLSPTNKQDKKLIVHTNDMLSAYRGGSYYYEYIRGIKTGTTDTNTQNLVTLATQSGYTYMCVVFGGRYKDSSGVKLHDTYVDTKNLYKWAFNTFVNRTVVDTNSLEAEVPVRLSADKDYVLATPETDVTLLIPNADILDLSTIQKIATVDKNVTAPVKKGEVIGTLELRLQDETLTTVNLVASENVNRSTVLYILDVLRRFFTNKFVIAAIILLILLIIAYVIFSIQYNRNKIHKKNITSRRVKASGKKIRRRK